jgi:hypothetical protein
MESGWGQGRVRVTLEMDGMIQMKKGKGRVVFLDHVMSRKRNLDGQGCCYVELITK